MVIHRQFDSTIVPTVINSHIYIITRCQRLLYMFSILIRAAKLFKKKVIKIVKNVNFLEFL